MIPMKALIHDVRHIQFECLDTALEFRQAYGGHLFVSKGARHVVWFSSRFTVSSILMSPVLVGTEGVLNPLEEQLENLRGLSNPYPLGSVAHNHFAVIYERALGQSRDLLQTRYQVLTSTTKDFLNCSSSKMAEDDFEAEVIAKVYQYKFDRPLPQGGQAVMDCASSQGSKE